MPESAATRRARRGGSATPGRAWDVRWFDTIDSTNRYLLEQARGGAPEGLVAVAEHQTAGRGRLGRTWESAAGAALLVSVLLRPALPADRLPLVTMAAGLALADAVAEVAAVTARLKWPNDLVVADRKLAGLLAEADVAQGTARALVVGAGCNVTGAAVPPALRDVATACEVEAGRPVDRAALLARYLDAYAARLADLPAVVPAYRAASATLGREVRVELGAGRSLTGRADDVTDTGALVVREPHGPAHVVSVGDVVHLRTLDEPSG